MVSPGEPIYFFIALFTSTRISLIPNNVQPQPEQEYADTAPRLQDGHTDE
jgi:hypothetical protein